MAEKLDIYNCNRIKNGKIIERKKEMRLNDDEYILAVQCWIINDNGEILLTQRRLDKSNGGMWEPTGGLAQSGENSMQAVKRELQEEIGLKVADNEIKLVKERKDEDNSFRDIYVINKNIDVKDLNFTDGEVIDAKYATADELCNMIQEGKSFKWLTPFINDYIL